MTTNTRPSTTSGDEDEAPSAQLLVSQMARFPAEHVFLVKDFHPYLGDPLIVRQLRDALPVLVAQRKTIIFFGSITTVPVELVKDAVKLELPLPAYEDLRDEFDLALAELRSGSDQRTPHPSPLPAEPGRGDKAIVIELSVDDEDRLIKAVMGLTAQEARKAWRRALHGRSELSDEVFTTLIAEKRTLASGSDFLEFYDLDEGVGDIGGLDQLKDWLSQRALAYTPRAR